MIRSLEERFWSKVDTSGDCWTWMAACNRQGYGLIGIGSRSTRKSAQLAHRVAYELEVGTIPSGLIVRHKCDNPPCVNPSHLEIGTRADNSRDMRVRGRSIVGELNPRSKLTANQVVLIRERLATGASVAVVARDFSMSCGAIKNIRSGKSWGGGQR